VKKLLCSAFTVFFLLAGPAAASSKWEKSMQAATAAKKAGDFEKAEEHMLKALMTAERFGKADLRRAHSLNNLAFLYYYQGDFTQAEPFFERSLEAFEAAEGPAHEDTLLVVENLASLYEATRKHEKAESLYRRLLASAKSGQGPNSLAAAAMMNNVALNLDARGRLADAIMLYKKALAIREKNQGEKHPEVAEILNNLAFSNFSSL